MLYPTRSFRLTILADLFAENASFPYRDNVAELNARFNPAGAEMRQDGYWEAMAPNGTHVLLLNRVEHPHYLHVTWEVIGIRLAQCF